MSLFIKGIIIGIGKILPGISGAMLAISFGIYDKLIIIIGKFPKINKKDIKYLLILFSGIIIGMIFLSKIIVKLLNNNYFAITLLFAVIISIYFIKMLIEQIKQISIKNVILFIVGLAIIILLSQINDNKINPNNTYYNYFLIGVIESFSSIIPGISGTALLISFGFYEQLMNLLSSLLNLTYLKENIISIIMFLLGILITTISLAKTILFLLKNYKDETNYVILGFLLASIILIFK